MVQQSLALLPNRLSAWHSQAKLVLRWGNIYLIPSEYNFWIFTNSINQQCQHILIKTFIIAIIMWGFLSYQLTIKSWNYLLLVTVINLVLRTNWFIDAGIWTMVDWMYGEPPCNAIYSAKTFISLSYRWWKFQSCASQLKKSPQDRIKLSHKGRICKLILSLFNDIRKRFLNYIFELQESWAKLCGIHQFAFEH